MLAAWRGREPEACELIEATVQEATARGTGRMASFAAYVSSVRQRRTDRPVRRPG